MSCTVAVAVIRRLGVIPRDRRRDVFLTHFRSLNADITTVYGALDWSYEVATAANAAIEGETTVANAFIKPLQFQGIDGRPRLVGPDFFAADGTDMVGMVRTIRFGGAELIVSKS